MTAENKSGNDIQAIANAEPSPTSEGYLRIRLEKLMAEEKMLQKLSTELEGIYLNEVLEKLKKIREEQGKIKQELLPFGPHDRAVVSIPEKENKYAEALAAWKSGPPKLGDILVIPHPSSPSSKSDWQANRWETHFLLPDKKGNASYYVTKHFKDSYIFKALGDPTVIRDRKNLTSTPTFLALVRKLMLTPAERSWRYPKHLGFSDTLDLSLSELSRLGIQHNHCVSCWGSLPIHGAAWGGKFAEVDALVADDKTLMEIRSDEGNGYNPLQHAIYSIEDKTIDGRKEVVKTLLVWGCNINNARPANTVPETALQVKQFEEMEAFVGKLAKRRIEQAKTNNNEIKRIREEVEERKKVITEKDAEITQLKAELKLARELADSKGTTTPSSSAVLPTAPVPSSSTAGQSPSTLAIHSDPSAGATPSRHLSPPGAPPSIVSFPYSPPDNLTTGAVRGTAGTGVGTAQAQLRAQVHGTAKVLATDEQTHIGRDDNSKTTTNCCTGNKCVIL